MNATSAAVARAAELLRECAVDLKFSHTVGESWAGEDEAKAAHEEYLAVAEALDALELTSAPAAPDMLREALGYAEHWAAFEEKRGNTLDASRVRKVVAHLRAPAETPPAAGAIDARERSDDMLSTAIGIIQGQRQKAPYTDDSPIAKFVAEAAEWLKDWPFAARKESRKQTGPMRREDLLDYAQTFGAVLSDNSGLVSFEPFELERFIAALASRSEAPAAAGAALAVAEAAQRLMSTGCAAGVAETKQGGDWLLAVEAMRAALAATPAPERKEAPYKSCMNDGRCGICGGDWSVCGCEGMLRRTSTPEPDDSPLETGEGDAR